MNDFEELQQIAYESGVKLIEDYPFQSDQLKGLYADNTIALNEALCSSMDKTCILAEELGHHFTSVGNIIHLKDVRCQKQERKARMWAYDRQIGLRGLIRAYEANCADCHDMADFLEVTPTFLEEALEAYRERYGVFTELDSYLLIFIPALYIVKRLE